ncbi:hypothetical protein BH10BAC2_BH10BAC2_25750 [soil metagenome]
MKKIITLICCLFAVITIHAQTPKIYVLPKEKMNDSSFANRFKNKQYVDSLKYALKLPKGNYGTIPLAGSMPRKLSYIGNNQQGFDIYQTPQDNMCILKPDATFSSNMPVANSLQVQIKPVEMPNPQKERIQ